MVPFALAIIISACIAFLSEVTVFWNVKHGFRLFSVLPANNTAQRTRSEAACFGRSFCGRFGRTAAVETIWKQKSRSSVGGRQAQKHKQPVGNRLCRFVGKRRVIIEGLGLVDQKLRCWCTARREREQQS
jgi:hypothetical protein